MNSFPSSPLPPDPPQSTRKVFHIENLYLSLGDEFDSLLEDISWIDLDAHGDKPSDHLSLLALVTVFQHAEELPDDAAARATRERTDWKYALRLPLDYPGLDPAELSEFRRRLERDPTGQSVFRRLLTRLGEIGLRGTGIKTEVSVTKVLRAIDSLTRGDKMFTAMRLALEHLAATHPAWLRANRLPHWLERYDPVGNRRRGSNFSGGLRTLSLLQSDVAHLLSAIARSDLPDLSRLPEIQVLQRLAAEFEPPAGDG
jgi:hypothetical protein